MFFTSKKLRKFRRRAWLAGIVVMASGCVYWGGSLAWAHSRPNTYLLPPEMPSLLSRAKAGLEDWVPVLPPSKPQDLLANPELHAQEENCNVAGFYADSAADIDLHGEGWKYSSLAGLEAEVGAPRSDDPKKYGYNGDAPVWMMVQADRLAVCLPEGLRFSPRVRALESRLWPSEQRGQLLVHLKDGLSVSTDKKSVKLDQAWRHLPSAPVMGCLRREVVSALFAPGGGRISHLANSGEHWVGAALDSPLDESQWDSLWNRVQAGWAPSAVWVDFSANQVASAREVAMSHDDVGTLYAVGMEAVAGSSTVPGEGTPGERVGAGRFQWASQRVEWLAELSQGQLLISYHWAEAPLEADAVEVATMKADLESVYNIRPNVIAGR